MNSVDIQTVSSWMYGRGRCTEKIASALKQKRKEVALNHLRARKRLDDLLKKRLGSLDILHSTLIRVEASAGDVQVRRTKIGLFGGN